LRVIELDGSAWKTCHDFYQSLFDGIEQGYPHGKNPNAFIDSMIWRGMGGIEPPYTVRVVNLKSAPKEIRDEVAYMVSVITEARKWRFAHGDGVDIEVSIVAPDLINPDT
jgi:hypothetical protein